MAPFVTMRDELSTYKQIQKEILMPALDRIASERGELASLAKRLEEKNLLKHAKHRLSELRSGRRVLSFFFLKIMIDGGVMTVNQIKRGRKTEDLKGVEQEIVLRLEAEKDELLLVAQAKEEGIDVKQLLKIAMKRS